MMEFNLKESLIKLMKELFGSDIETRWTTCYFPFTHPSYELEIKFQGEWMEMLGSGIMRQSILENGGVIPVLYLAARIAQTKRSEKD